MNQNQIDRKALKLANELLGGIEYGDSRDNPKWRKQVVEAAGRLIADLVKSFLIPRKNIKPKYLCLSIDQERKYGAKIKELLKIEQK